MHKDSLEPFQQELDLLLQNVGHINYKGELTIQGIHAIHHILRANHNDAIETAILLDFRERVAQQALTPEAYAELQALYLQPARQQAYAYLYQVQEEVFSQIRDHLQRIPIEVATRPERTIQRSMTKSSFGNDFMHVVTLGQWGKAKEEVEQ